jgi:hypothetical protein
VTEGATSDGAPNGRLRFAEAVELARECLESLGGKQSEAVSGANRMDDGGWLVSFDVVELARIPPSTDVLATYDVTLDAEGELVEMTRARRFTRGQANED